MNNKVFISCAVTGSGDTASKHPDLPKTPEQIAKASIEAAKAGAAIAHIHVREDDGTPSRRLDLYKEVIDRIRSSDTDVILNLTTGMVVVIMVTSLQKMIRSESTFMLDCLVLVSQA